MAQNRAALTNELKESLSFTVNDQDNSLPKMFPLKYFYSNIKIYILTLEVYFIYLYAMYHKLFCCFLSEGALLPPTGTLLHGHTELL